jgi:hypothetical protein
MIKRDPLWRGVPKPKRAWCALDRDGNLMADSVRDRAEDVRLACGECVPVAVIITVDTEALAAPRPD